MQLKVLVPNLESVLFLQPLLFSARLEGLP